MHRPNYYTHQVAAIAVPPSLLAVSTSTSTSTKTGVMTSGGAQVTLCKEQDSVVSTRQSLKGEKGEKGEKGDKGDKGDRGKKGSTGKAGPKVLIWSEEILLHDDSVTPILTFPYDYHNFVLDNVTLVTEGTGSVSYSLVERKTGENLAVISKDLVDDLTFVTHNTFSPPNDTLTVLTLQATVTGPAAEPIKFLSVEITMKHR